MRALVHAHQKAMAKRKRVGSSANDFIQRQWALSDKAKGQSWVCLVASLVRKGDDNLLSISHCSKAPRSVSSFVRGHLLSRTSAAAS